MSTVLEAQGLSRTLPGDPPVTLVREVSFAVEPGTFTAITGPSGCGKSSLLYLLGMIDRPSEGALLLNGADVAGLDGDARAQLRLEHFGFVFQFHFLLPEFTALENVMIPAMVHAKKSDAIRLRATDLLETVGLKDRMEHKPGELSGGEQQRVAIARALINDPRILLADEPTGQLDSRTAGEIMTLLTQMNLRGKTVLVITHDPHISSYAGRVVRIKDGQIVIGNHEPVD